MTAVPKLHIVRDPKWIEHVKTMPCILTGQSATEDMAVDPVHIGTLGRGIKSSDDEVLPVIHYLHVRGHNSGEVSMFRTHMPDWLVREALRAYARQMYNEWVIL